MNDSETVDVNDDLDAFSTLMFNPDTPEDVKENEEVTETPSATDEVEDLEEEESTVEEADEDDTLAEQDEDTDEDEEAETKLFKVKGRKPAKERINELTAKAKEAERRADALAQQLEELRKAPKTEADKPVQTTPLEDGAPSPEATLDNGDPVYPLGEFDPKYIRDLTRFTIAQETAIAKQEAAEARQREEMEQAEAALLETWNEKLEAASERLPDFREKALGLEDTFTDLEPNYGKYLVSTIMSLEYGPDVLAYLADNIAEARKIVAAGPTQATIALGRLEAKVAMSLETPSDEVDKGKAGKVPTKAPTPPPHNKGNSGKRTVAGDTDDLDAFEKTFFTKK